MAICLEYFVVLGAFIWNHPKKPTIEKDPKQHEKTEVWKVIVREEKKERLSSLPIYYLGKIMDTFEFLKWILLA